MIISEDLLLAYGAFYETYKVNETEISDFLKFLSSDELEGRETGTKGIEKAAVFLEDFFKKNNFSAIMRTDRVQVI